MIWRGFHHDSGYLNVGSHPKDWLVAYGSRDMDESVCTAACMLILLCARNRTQLSKRRNFIGLHNRQRLGVFRSLVAFR